LSNAKPIALVGCGIDGFRCAQPILRFYLAGETPALLKKSAPGKGRSAF
jgi:hypothetical protein